MLKKILLISLAIIALTGAKANAQYLCGSTGYIYRNQGFCNANCSLNGNSSPCEELSSSSTPAPSCPSGYQGFVFDPNNNTTYAITTTSQFWTTFDSPASSSSMAIIPNGSVNSLLNSILIYYDIPNAWIGLYNPQMSTDYNTVNPDRPYSWTDGSTPSYYNWASGEPNNALPSQDLSLLPESEYGQHWIEMESNGEWNDIGYNYTYPSSQNYAPYLPALVQFNNQLSCVSGVEPPTQLTTGQEGNLANQYCGGDTANCYLCSDGANLEQCQSGNTYPSGTAYLCPAGQTQCNENTNTPQCPSDSTYNSSLNECTAPPVCPSGYTFINNECSETLTAQSTCPTGSTYNSSSNECVTTDTTAATCPSGTSYNSSTGQCVTTTTATPTCPSGTTYGSGQCTAAPICPTNYTYDSSTGECSETLTTQDSCPTGYTMQSNGTCLSTATTTPTCSVGSFSNGQCISTPQCPTGYSLSSGTCTEAATSTFCPSGYVYDNSIGQCEIATISVNNSPNPVKLNTVAGGSVTVSGSGNTLTINGQGFQSGDSIAINIPYCNLSGSQTGWSWTCASGYGWYDGGCWESGGYPDGPSTIWATKIVGNGSYLSLYDVTDSNNYWIGNISVSDCSVSGSITLNNDSASNPTASVSISGSSDNEVTYKQSNGAGGGSLAFSSTVPTASVNNSPNPVKLNTVAGGSVTVSGSGNTLTINGQGFQSGDSIAINIPYCNLSGSQTGWSWTCASGYGWYDGGCWESGGYPDGPSTIWATKIVGNGSYLSLYDVTDSNNYWIGNISVSDCSVSGSITLNNDSASNPTASVSISGSSDAGVTYTYSQSNGAGGGSLAFSDTTNQNPTCPDGGSFSNSTCTAVASCPTNSTLASGECVVSAECPTNYTYNTSTDLCDSNATATPICPTNYTLSANGECLSSPTATPTCPSGTTFSASNNDCQSTATCPTNYTLTNNECAENTFSTPNVCPSGYALVGSQCVYTSNSTPICPSGYTLESNGTCSETLTQAPTCSLSGFTFVNGACVSAAAMSCSSSYSITFNFSNFSGGITLSNTMPFTLTTSGNSIIGGSGTDGGSITYSNGSLSGGINIPNVVTLYTSGNSITGITGYGNGTSSPNGSIAFGNGVFSGTIASTVTSGVTFTGSGNSIIATYNGENLGEITAQGQGQCTSYSCPLNGNNDTCVNTGSGYYCSQYSCVNYNSSSAYTINNPPVNANNPTNNGQTNSAGECLGQIYIFSGQALQCRDPGIQTGWGGGCCTADKRWFGLSNCNSREKLLAEQRSAGDCTMVGTYCAQSFLGYCLQTDQTWCCFPSLLANIIQQQTRAMQGLPIYGWGTPTSPNCIGYTPQQFQAINFSKINLSAFYNSIEQQTSSLISNAATNAVNKFQQSLGGN